MYQTLCFHFTDVDHNCEDEVPTNQYRVLSARRCELNPKTAICFLLHFKGGWRRIFRVPPSLPKNSPALVAQMNQNNLAFQVHV